MTQKSISKKKEIKDTDDDIIDSIERGLQDILAGRIKEV